MHCLATGGQWAVQLLQCSASPLGAVGVGTLALHCPTVWGPWAVELLSSTATVLRGSGQWNSCNALPHCLGVVGSAPPAMHFLTSWGQWAVQLLQCAGTLPWDSGGGGAPAVVPWTMGLGVVPRGSCADQPWESSVLPLQEQDGSRCTPEDAPPGRPSGS